VLEIKKQIKLKTFIGCAKIKYSFSDNRLSKISITTLTAEIVPIPALNIS